MSDSQDIAEHLATSAQRDEVLELGMWTFLSTEVLLFGGLILSYFVYRHADPQAFLAAGRETRIVIGTVNTALLLTSSFCVAAALQAAEQGARRATRTLLGIAILLGLSFLGLKGVEYLGEYREHLVPGVNFARTGQDAHGIELFFIFYFIATLLHGVHVVAGIGVLAVFAAMATATTARSRYIAGLRTAALYWHFVDLVWIFLFALIYLPGRSS
ncbi:cytochrome c oxidase subunit 3 [Nitrobacter sp.]|uniref:cytochrome c oxidase subunit 3 n=1 Tax=Nitrobacter sp. TaxID=29420 RepID=UPI0029CAB0BE|nr:cytochrome c oxidase subunit 3 [Nitrobacter sp.]